MIKQCGCCEGIEILTPAPIVNRPGLNALSYRVGTHATFLETMLARLSSHYLEIFPEDIQNWLLRKADMIDPNSLTLKLKNGYDPLSKFLREHFSEDLQASLEAYDGPNADTDSIYQKIIDELNYELTTFDLIQEVPYLKSIFSTEINQWLKEISAESEFMPINRLLLEVNYPNDFLRIRRLFPLGDLRTRSTDDTSIALLDAWATVADVLSFYQERFANEAYLRTATERRSILELAKLVGYKLHPGVSASVYLAFTLEQGYNDVVIPTGTRAQSLPGPGEMPQFFETGEPLQARAEWNNLPPRNYQPQTMLAIPQIIYLKGTNTKLKPNYPLIIIDFLGNEGFYRVLKVEADHLKNVTKVTLLIRGEVQLELSMLENLIRPENIPEEEGPYSVSIGDYIINNTVLFAKILIENLRNAILPSGDSIRIIMEQIPLLEQSVRVLKALNFEILANWIKKVIRELHIIMMNLRRRLDSAQMTPYTVEGLNFEELANELYSKLQASLPTSKKPFSREIGTEELRKIKKLITDLIEVLRDITGDISEQTKLSEINSIFLQFKQLKYIFDDLNFSAPRRTWVSDIYDLLDLGISWGEPGPGVQPFTRIPISGLVLPLIRLPSIQPRNSLRLSRSLSRTFATNSDLMPQVLTTFNTRLRSILYQAWGNTQVKPSPAKVIALRVTASVFGHNALENKLEGYTGTGTATDPLIPKYKDWQPTDPGDESDNIIYLDSAYESIISGGYAAIQKPESTPPQIIGGIEAVNCSRTAYGISSKTTKITLPGGETWWDSANDDFDVIRGTVVYAESEMLELAEEPIADDISGDSIQLDGLFDGLNIGRWLIVSGERTDIPGTKEVYASELVMVSGITQDIMKIELFGGTEIEHPGDSPHTTIHFAEELAYTYKRDTIKIFGNVAKATHGETVNEILGSGDSSKSFQQFNLSRKPLTFLAASTPRGVKSTLEVRVNDVLWHEKETLAGLELNDRNYITQTDNDDITSPIFGDGKQGARLPTGVENVKAKYRIGIGKVGNVKAEQISLLATQPLGVKSVINPLRASGGGNRESQDQARRNTPLAVKALDRLVSVQDYADFARTYAGIAKASAARLSDGRRQVVHITIAGTDDIPIDENSDLYQNLLQAFHRNGDPYQPIEVKIRELKLVVIIAKVQVGADYIWESVEPEIRSSLLEKFGFECRELGQDVTLSEVVSTIQSVEGVSYVDVDKFDAIEETNNVDELDDLANTLELKPRIIVEMARIDSGVTAPAERILPAQLAYISPDVSDYTLILTEISQ